MNESTEPAQASVSMGGLAIDGSETTTQDGTVRDVRVEVEGNWEYDVPGRKNPSQWQAVLWARKDGEQAVVGLAEGSAKYLSMDGSYSLTGSLIATELYSLGDFQASENGSTNTTTLDLQLVFNVFNSNEGVIAHAELTESADVTVSNQEYSASSHGDAGGSGSVIIVE